MDETPIPQRLAVRTATGWVPLGFVRDQSILYLIARERTARWPIEALRTGVAQLRLPEGEVQGRTALVTGANEQRRILDLFRGAYGPEQFARWYDRPARILRVDLDPHAAAALAPDSQYAAWLESEFDNVAEDYDHHITGNRMNRLLRDRSIAELRRSFAGRRHLLEVGCGSGMETMTMLQEGHEVLAVDISDRMLAVVRSKASREGVGERLRTVKLRARDLGRLPRETGGAAFDGAYSTYGALNCEPSLRPIADAFAELLLPDAPLIVGIYNRWCLFEIVGYTLTGQAGRALGRRTNPVRVGASRFCIDVFAYSVADVEAAFGDWFDRRRLEGVPVVLPPSDLTSYSERFSRRFDRLAAWDAWVGRQFPWNHLGDHFLATYRRRANPRLAHAS
jgi:SAM-dependent methyltransferase